MEHKRKIIKEVSYSIPAAVYLDEPMWKDEDEDLQEEIYKVMNIFEVWTDFSRKILHLVFSESVWAEREALEPMMFLKNKIAEYLETYFGDILKGEKQAGQGHYRFVFDAPVNKPELKMMFKELQKELSQENKYEGLFKTIIFPWDKKFIDD